MLKNTAAEIIDIVVQFMLYFNLNWDAMVGDIIWIEVELKLACNSVDVYIKCSFE